MGTLAHQKQKTQTTTHRKFELFSAETWKQIEESRFGMVPLILIGTACIGGICAAFGTGDSPFELGLTVFPTIISLVLIIAVAPMKSIIYLSILAVIVDLAVLIF